MTTITELFESQGPEIQRHDIQFGDLVAMQPKGELPFIVDYWSKSSRPTSTITYRLIHRPSPKLPTSPGSILADTWGHPDSILLPDGEWYVVSEGETWEARLLQASLADGTLTILLDTGSTQ